MNVEDLFNFSACTELHCCWNDTCNTTSTEA